MRNFVDDVMPPLTRREVLQLSLLLLIVPIQYLLTQELQQPNQSKSKILKDLFDKLNNFYENWLIPEKVNKLWGLLSFIEGPAENSWNDGESPAIEVLELRKKQEAGYFASSDEPRYDRSQGIRYRIGDVVENTNKGYKGVIVGWDYEAQVPTDLIIEMYKNHKHWMKEPNYLVAIDTRFRAIPQFAYLSEEILQLVSHTRVIHPNLENYFESFDGTRYVPRPWLHKVYPKD